VIGGKHLAIALAAVLVGAAPARALQVNLRIASDRQVKLASSTQGVVMDAAGRELARIPARQAVTAQAIDDRVAMRDWRARSLRLVPTGEGEVWVGGRWYRGSARLRTRGRGITVINQVRLEPYLYSVVAAEVPAVWPMEALKAQAVAARSYVLAHMREGDAPFKTNQDFQVYEGLDSEYSSSRRAVQATRGIVLVRGGETAKTLYAARRELAESRWGRGMGQKEAKQLAKRGWSWRQILGEFYPKAKLASLGGD